MSHKGDVPTREQLLKSIRIIKGQRQRANLTRIIKSLKNHHNFNVINEKAVNEVLESAVEAGILQTVWKNDEVAYQEFVQSMPKIYKGPKKAQLYAAIQGIIDRRGDENGLPLKVICEEMSNTDICRSMNPVLLKYTVKICCLKMVTRQLLIRNGQFFKMGIYGCMATSGDEEEVQQCIVDKAVSDKKPATPIEICSLCMNEEKLDDNGEKEELIYCVECGRSGHPGCLQFSSKLTEKVRTLRWQCIECKKCSVCAEQDRAHSMLFCDNCDRGFHMDCCKPPIMKPPKGFWSCCICDYEKSQRSKNLRFIKRQVGGAPFNFKRKSTSGGFRKYMKKNKTFLRSLKGKSKTKYDSCDDDFDLSAFESELFKKAVDEIKNIPEEDREKFKKCQAEVKEKLFTSHTMSLGQNRPTPGEIHIGKYQVNTWYSSPYPNGFNKLPKLHICEFCLTYVETSDVLKRHQTRCNLRHPPGNEIYREDGGRHSVFEVDGNTSKIYSQNLCLLAKLFLDHKTLYFDVEPFLFYVLTVNDFSGCHFVGYFSKEKYCQQKYNLSCIMTLPQYQRYGYGSMLIDFSYALSRKEGVTGTPEKPLSDLGQLSYQSYWSGVVVEQINKSKDRSISVKAISEATGLDKHDVLSTLMSLSLLKEDNGKLKTVIASSLLSKYEKKRKRKIDESLLKWTPHAPAILEEMEDEQVKEEKPKKRLRSSSGSSGSRKKKTNSLTWRSPARNRIQSKNGERKNSETETGPRPKSEFQSSPVTSTPVCGKFRLRGDEDEDLDLICDVSKIKNASSSVGGMESSCVLLKKRGRPKSKNLMSRPSLFDAITPIKADMSELLRCEISTDAKLNHDVTIINNNIAKKVLLHETTVCYAPVNVVDPPGDCRTTAGKADSSCDVKYVTLNKMAGESFEPSKVVDSETLVDSSSGNLIALSGPCVTAATGAVEENDMEVETVGADEAACFNDTIEY